MIYTSYFANIKNLSNDMITFSIARWKPKQYKGATIISLAPSLELLQWWRASDKSELAKEKYIKTFNNYLNTKNPEQLVKLLKQKCNNKIPVLLCFEKPEEFCHRHLIANWLNKNGIKCKELEKSDLI